MCIVCECEKKNDYSKLVGLQYLYCCNCPNIKSIPIVEGLFNLYCFHCPNLEMIPKIKGLKHLYCVDCPKLKNISVKGLQKLYCRNCPNIQGIVQQKNLMICHGNYHDDESFVFQYKEDDVMARKICNLDTGIWEPKMFVLCPDCKEFCDKVNDGMLARYEIFSKKREDQVDLAESNKCKVMEQIQKLNKF